MPRIKLVKVISEDYEEYNIRSFCEDLSDWEEISDEEYDFLKSHGIKSEFNNFIKNKYSLYEKIIILEEVTNTGLLREKIKNIKDHINKAKIEHEKRERIYKQKKKAAKEKREAAKIENAKKVLREAGEIT